MRTMYRIQGRERHGTDAGALSVLLSSVRARRHGTGVGCLVLLVTATVASAAPIHTTYLWHMHQPIYWPDESTWVAGEYETAYAAPLSDQAPAGNGNGDIETAEYYTLDIPGAGVEEGQAVFLLGEV